MFPDRKLSHYVFPKGGNPMEHRDQVSATFKKIIENLRINADIKDRRGKGVFHTLRHTFASWLVQDGEPLFKIGKYMGQKTPRMTDRYSHLAPEHDESAANRLNARRLALAQTEFAKLIQVNARTLQKLGTRTPAPDRSSSRFAEARQWGT